MGTLTTWIKVTFPFPVVPGWDQQKVEKGKKSQDDQAKSSASRSQLISLTQSEAVHMHTGRRGLVLMETRAFFFLQM